MMQALAEALPDLVPEKSAYGESMAYFERHLVGFLDSAKAHTMTHSELERELEQRGNEILRLLLQDHIDSRGSGEVNGPVVDNDGEQRTRPHAPSQKDTGKRVRNG